MLVNDVGLVGRDNELQQINNALINGSNVVIIAPKNFGKSTLFDYCCALARDYNYFALQFPDNTFKESLKILVKEYHATHSKRFYLPKKVEENELSEAARKEKRSTGKISWQHLHYYFGRLETGLLIKWLFYSFYWMHEEDLKAGITPRKPIIFVQNLKRITDANVPRFNTLFHHCQIIATLDSQYQHLKHLNLLITNFQTIIELKPLASDFCHQIVEKWLDSNLISFESDKAHDLFIKHVARDCAGQPGIIQKMLKQAKLEPEVTREKVRDFERRDVQYMSMYPIGMIFLAIMTILRTLGRSMGDTTWLVIGAVCGILFMISFFLRSTLDKE